MLQCQLQQNLKLYSLYRQHFRHFSIKSKLPIQNTLSEVQGKSCKGGLERRATPKHLVFTPLSSSFLFQPKDNSEWKIIHEEYLKAANIPEDWNKTLEIVQENIGVTFDELLHLKCAMIHHGSLISHQATKIPSHRLSNRCLEFLGDSVLGMCTSSYLFQKFPLFQEGQLSTSKAAIVNNLVLSRVCREVLNIHEHILVGVDFDLAIGSKTQSYIKGRQTIEAGAIESIIGAIYLDKGLESSLEFVNKRLLPHTIRYASESTQWDPISELQMLLQANQYPAPVYKRIPAPSTDKSFQVELYVNGKKILKASGPSYKLATIQAAEKGFQVFRELLST